MPVGSSRYRWRDRSAFALSFACVRDAVQRLRVCLLGGVPSCTERSEVQPRILKCWQEITLRRSGRIPSLSFALLLFPHLEVPLPTLVVATPARGRRHRSRCRDVQSRIVICLITAISRQRRLSAALFRFCTSKRCSGDRQERVVNVLTVRYRNCSARQLGMCTRAQPASDGKF